MLHVTLKTSVENIILVKHFVIYTLNVTLNEAKLLFIVFNVNISD